MMIRLLLLLLLTTSSALTQSTLLPKHVTPAAAAAIDRGLRFLVAGQARDGSWQSAGAASYPVAISSLAGLALLAEGSTPTRGPHAETLERLLYYLQSKARPDGLITGSSAENGRPMYGHGLALTFLAVAHGMVAQARTRAQLGEVITRAVAATAAAQSDAGGWTYLPGDGDEGSVTITQIQALRAAHNAGFVVPAKTVNAAVAYIERCAVEDGGIRYAAGGEAKSLLPITAAAVATLYNASQFDSPLAVKGLAFVEQGFKDLASGWAKGTENDFYAHFYAAQGFFAAGDRHWDAYFPTARDQLLARQLADGSWQGDQVGPVYGTAVALVILQLPYKLLPIYQQ